MLSSWCVQYRAFLWKIVLLRLRSPGTSIAELLLPCFFTLLLALGYWSSSTTYEPTADYSSKLPTNLTTLLPAFFCQNISHPRPFGPTLPVGPCQASVNTTVCLPFVRDGALCVRDGALMSRVMRGVYYGKGAVVVPTFDAYLALSAFATYEALRVGPTFMSRGGHASLSHYGQLLLVGDGSPTSVAAEFSEFCSNTSVLCAEVVYKDQIFPSMKAAQEFTKRNDGKVWAIAELPTPSSGVKGQGNIFTISMNYTATPWTFEPNIPFTRGLGGNDYMLYVTSGFLTLQNTIQLFYSKRLLANLSSSSKPIFPPGVDPDGIFNYVNLYGPTLVPMPTPPYQSNPFYSSWSYLMPLVAMLAAVFPVAKLVSSIVEEKSLKIRESMQIMGLRWSCMAFGWFTSAFVTDAIASLLAIVILRLSLFSYVKCLILFAMYFSFMQQNSALSLFLSSLFTNPRVAGTVAALTIFVCCVPFYAAPNGMSTSGRFLMGLIPCVAYAEAFNQLVTYSSFEYTYSWSNMYDGEFPVAAAIGLMWASSAIFLIMWMYLDQVLPSSIGRRRHPLFFLQPFRRCFSCCREREESVPVMISGDLPTERSEGRLPQERAELLNKSDERFPAVFCKLRKVYETGGIIRWLRTFVTGLRRNGDICVAVRDVSFALERGRVNILLGANGSGKSTLMGMATGMIKPTSGDVFICGYNAVHELEKCHQEIGYCPQLDIIWNKLTVEQHLAFYARLKSETAWNVQGRVDKMITTLQLEGKRHTHAENLSGGQRRRLCVGISLIGNPTVLFLDEPTSGMDMQGRKAVYEAIQDGCESRAVMISTHLLNDADRLGDRILLMQKGELCGAGTSLFLKSKMGVGYVLTCVVDTCESEMEENIYISSLTEFVRTKAYPGHYAGDPSELQPIPPGCKLLGIERRGREISFRFPLSLLSSTGTVIIKGLEERRDALHLHSIGLSLTTLQDVLDFVADPKPRQELEPGREGPFETLSGQNGAQLGISIQVDESRLREPSIGSPVTGGDGFSTRGDAHDVESSVGHIEVGIEEDNSHHYPRQYKCSFFSHFAALFKKRVHYGKRDVRLLVFHVLLPVIFLIVALLIDLVKPPKQPEIVLDVALYPKYDEKPYSVIPWTSSSKLPDVFGVGKSDISNAFGPYYTPVKVLCDEVNCSSSLSTFMISDLMSHEATRQIGLSLTNQLGTEGVPSSLLMHNVSSAHAAGQSLNVLYNVVNYQLFGKAAMMTARNQPMSMGPGEEKMVGGLHRVVSGIFILVPFLLIPANIVSFMVRENQSGSRHLQWLAGANVFAFWLSSMIFDFVCFLFTEALALLVFVAFNRTEFIGTSETVAATLALFSTYGLTSIPFTYVISFFFRSPFIAQNVVLVVSFVFGFLWVIVEWVVRGGSRLETFVLFATHFARMVPSVAFGEGMFVLSGNEVASLVVPDRERSSLFSVLSIKNGRFTGGIGSSLSYMGGTFIISWIVLLLLEIARVHRFHWFFSRWFCCHRFCRRSHDCHPTDLNSVVLDGNTETHNNNDIEGMRLRSVRTEEASVSQYPTGRPCDTITLQRVSKRYGNSTKDKNNDNESKGNSEALSSLTLGVHQGEILALLGHNGAGKSTVVGILAGSIVPTSGDAFINHHSVMRSSSRRFVGYCPERDALLDNLSPHEHLTLYAVLRGASSAYIKCEIPQLLHALGLESQRNTPSYALSGGDKRRLALALALVGGTTSVLLDEPTAGMDAVARRQMCAVVRRLTKDKSVILTTHLLDECEALADRVAFMSRGRLRCVGTPQELKAYCAHDAVYLVQVVFLDADTTRETDNTAISRRLCEYFQTFADTEGETECTVETVVGRTVTLQVRRSLSSICSIATAIREGAIEGLPPVVQMSATQSTLEEVLLRD